MAHPVLSRIRAHLEPFFSLDFDLKDAGTLGTVLQNGQPARVVIRPHDMKDALLVLRREDLENEPGFLALADYIWTTPLRVNETDLRETFGSFQVSHGLRPGVPEAWMFPVRGRPLPGQVLASVSSRDRNGHLEVPALTLRRFPVERYRMNEGKAVRFIVLADLGATELLPDPWPEPAWIWKLADVDALIQRLRPAIHFQVENRLEPSGPPLHLAFHPDSMAAFHPNALVRHLEPMASLIQLGDGLLELFRKRVTPEKLRERLDMETLPGRFRDEAETLFASKPVRPASLMQGVDAALSAQLEAVLAEPGFQGFQSAWLGLQYLAENLDPADGSRIEVYATPRDGEIRTLVEGVLEEEMNHPSGSPPAVVVLDGSFSAIAADMAHLGEIATQAARIDAPAVFGVSPGRENFEPSAWARLAGHPQAKYLIGASHRILLRQDPSVDATMMRCFHYTPTGNRPEMSLKGSAAWALAAAVAQSQALKGHPVDITAGAPIPPLLQRRGSQASDPLEPPAEPLRPMNGSADPLTHLTFDAATGRVCPAEPLRSLAFNPAPADAAPAVILKASLSGMLRRLEHQAKRSDEPAAVREMILAAIEARLPGALVDLQMETKPGWPRLVRIRIAPPFAVDGRTIEIPIEVNWKSR